jgi:hypothetical protein
VSVSDSLISSSSDSSTEKKKTAATTPEHKDSTEQNGDSTTHHDSTSDHGSDNKSFSSAKVDECTKDTWGGWAWKSIIDGYQSLTGTKPDSAKADENVADISTLTFSDDIFKTNATTTPAEVKPEQKPSTDTSGISGWFSKMGDAVANVGKEVTGHVTSAMDWLFSTTDSTGNKTEVSAKNGEAHVNGKNKDGVPVDVHVDKHKIEGQVGAAEIALDKDTKEGHYKSGAYDVTVQGTTKTVVDSATHQTFQWDEKAQKGFIADKDGKHIFDFNSREQLTQQLTPEKAITQTQTRADATADQVRAQMDAGQTDRQTRLIVDKDGDYAVVRRDGLMVKTYKNGDEHGPYVTVEMKGHVLKIQNNQAFYQHEDPVTHEKSWVQMRGHRHLMPPGLSVDENTGAVAVDGKTVVTANGNVEADGQTHIDTKSGKMTTSSDTGTVTVENSNGRTRVKHPGCGEIVNDGHTFINMDPKTKSTFSSMDSDSGEIRVFNGPNNAGITLDTRPGGNLTIRESGGQVTQMNNQGYFNSVDAQGNNLMSVDSRGDVSFYDGTTVKADGTVSNAYGSAQAWDGGSSATAAISKADTAVGAALAASSQYDPSGSSLGALDAADAELNSLAQVYTALGRYDLVGQINNTRGDISAARAKVLQVVQVSADSRRLTGDGSAARVHEALNSGSPEAYLRREHDEKTRPDDQTAVA